MSSNQITLDVKSFTENETAHASLLINKTDCGMLYLSPSELAILSGALISAQCRELTFNHFEPEGSADIDIDIFD